MKKLKKIDFVIFDPKSHNLGTVSAEFLGKHAKIVNKWLDYLVKKFCDHIMILWQMAGDLLANGWTPIPPIF